MWSVVEWYGLLLSIHCGFFKWHRLLWYMWSVVEWYGLLLSIHCGFSSGIVCCGTCGLLLSGFFKWYHLLWSKHVVCC